jgi:hypothetical protein
MSTTTFQKRQKEMKRLEKQKMKAERRANRKVVKGAEGGESQDEELRVMTGPAPLDFDLKLFDKEFEKEFEQ